MSQDIDHRIKKAQRKGIGLYLVSGLLTGTAIVAFILWLFLVKAYTIIVVPEQAKISSKITSLSAFTHVQGNRIYSLGASVEIEITADTFQSARVLLDSASPSTVEVELVPSPAQLSATLRINHNFNAKQSIVASNDSSMRSYLNDTQWFLNGQLKSVGSAFQYSTAPGQYQLMANNPYFLSEAIDLVLDRAEIKSVELPLSPAMGSLTLDSDPSGARVRVKDREIGNTPLVIELVTGDYQVVIEKEGMQTVEELIPIKVGFLDQKRKYNLEPVQAKLIINATPEDGTLLINNIEHRLGEVMLDANQTHNIEYNKAGFSTFNKALKLEEQKSTKLDIELNKTFGKLKLNANIPAKISVNGKPQGNLPTELSLSTVAHTLEFSYDGYRRVKKTVTPRANQTIPIDVNMLTEFEARRKEGKPLVAEQLGITMIRFSGTPFVMGSPANETGRRRNEHQINIEFSRQFWVSEKEITRAQYSAFTGNSVNSSDLPVTEVSWLEAAQFCNWLSEQEGLPVFYRFINGRYAGINKDSIGYRLPTEAEWEWLAKKSRRSTSTVYVWGNQTKLRDNQGNFADKSTQGSQLIYFDDYEDGFSGIAPVGSFKPDRSGIYDLDGNVSEWVHDFYTTSLPNTSSVHTDYMGAPSGESWVIKGGNYESGRLRELRAAFREFSSQGSKNVGFRIARYHN